MARTQKNKATSAHLGLLKAKLAKLRRELISPKGGGGGAGEQGKLKILELSLRIGKFKNVFYLQVLKLPRLVMPG